MVSRYQFLDMLLALHEKKFEHPREQLIMVVHWTFLRRNFIILNDNEVRNNCFLNKLIFFSFSIIKLWMR